jgi:hypothetical protein
VAYLLIFISQNTMRTRIYICLTILLKTCLGARAEAIIKFGTVTISTDTVNHNDSVFVDTWLQNTGNQNYHGTISFGFAINGVRNVNPNIFNNPYKGQTIDISPGDSLPLQFHIVVQSQYFLAGPDIFVVWPIVNGTNRTPDTVDVSIFVRDQATGMETEQQGANLRVYCSNQLLIVTNADYTNNISNLKVFDVLGNEIISQANFNHSELPLQNYPNGIYIVQVVLHNQQLRTFKVAKY